MRKVYCDFCGYELDVIYKSEPEKYYDYLLTDDCYKFLNRILKSLCENFDLCDGCIKKLAGNLKKIKEDLENEKDKTEK